MTTIDIETFLETAETAIDLVATPACATHWDQDSVLDGYRVGALAAHLGRAIGTVSTYLRASDPLAGVPPEAGGDTLDAAGYFTRALVDHDPVDSDFHRRVRERGVEAAKVGPDLVVAGLRTALDDVRSELTAPGVVDRHVEVIGGLVMRLGEYLDTRLVELCVHIDDLAASLDSPAPPLPAAAWDRVAVAVVDVAARRHGAAALAMSLARTERTTRLSVF